MALACEDESISPVEAGAGGAGGSGGGGTGGSAGPPWLAVFAGEDCRLSVIDPTAMYPSPIPAGTPPGEHPAQPLWSPSGAKLAHRTVDGAMILDFSSGWPGPEHRFADWTAAFELHWSPDSRVLVHAGAYYGFAVQMDGETPGASIPLGPKGPWEEWEFFESIGFSSASSQLAFTRKGLELPTLYLVDLSTSAPVEARLLGVAGQAQWSPDGSHIYFYDAAQGGVARVEASGGAADVELLSDDAPLGALALGRDVLAYQTSTDGLPEIVALDISGPSAGPAVTVGGPVPDDLRGPWVSPSSNRLAFSVGPDSVTKLVLVDVSTGVTAALDMPGQALHDDMVKWSIDNRWLTFPTRSGLMLVDLADPDLRAATMAQLSEEEIWWPIELAPDASGVVFSEPSGDFGDGGPEYVLKWWPLEAGGEPVEVTSFELGCSPTNCFSELEGPRFNPDSTSFVYLTDWGDRKTLWSLPSMVVAPSSSPERSATSSPAGDLEAAPVLRARARGQGARQHEVERDALRRRASPRWPRAAR